MPDLILGQIDVFTGNVDVPTQIHSGISQAVKDANEISMTKNIFGDNWIETMLTTEKTSFKGNNTDAWKEFGYFKQQSCNYGVDKENLPENSII